MAENGALPGRVLERLESMASSHAQLSAMLESAEVVVDHKRVREISIQKAALEPVVRAYTEYRRLASEAAELRRALAPGGMRSSRPWRARSCRGWRTVPRSSSRR
jgi:protein subunit release factor A